VRFLLEERSLAVGFLAPCCATPSPAWGVDGALLAGWTRNAMLDFTCHVHFVLETEGIKLGLHQDGSYILVCCRR
jgi:hypothetical protein